MSLCPTLQGEVGATYTDLVQLRVPTVVDDTDVGAVKQQHLDTVWSRLAVLHDCMVERRQTATVLVVRRRSEVEQRLHGDTIKHSHHQPPTHVRVR